MSCKPTSLEIISKPYLKCIIVISLYVIVFSAIFSFCMIEVIYGRYHMVHIIWTISYGLYHMVHIISGSYFFYILDL